MIETLAKYSLALGSAHAGYFWLTGVSHDMAKCFVFVSDLVSRLP